eukprot:6177085-Pleurochrysis_carterae.AAC.1
MSNVNFRAKRSAFAPSAARSRQAQHVRAKHGTFAPSAARSRRAQHVRAKRTNTRASARVLAGSLSSRPPHSFARIVSTLVLLCHPQVSADAQLPASRVASLRR